MDSKGYISNNNLNNIIDSIHLSSNQKIRTTRRNLKKNKSSQTVITLNQNKSYNPPKKQPEHYYTSNNENKKNIVNKIKFSEIPKTIESETNLEHKNIFDKIGNNKNKNSNPSKINSSKNIIFRKNLILNMPSIINSNVNANANANTNANKNANHIRKIISKKNNKIIDVFEMRKKENIYQGQNKRHKIYNFIL